MSHGAIIYAMTETMDMAAKKTVKTESMNTLPFSSLWSKYPIKNGMRTEAETVEAIVT